MIFVIRLTKTKCWKDLPNIYVYLPQKHCLKSYMSAKKRKEYFKILLSQRLDELLTEAKKTASCRTVPQDEPPDFADQASMETDSSFVFRIKERESRLIRKIKDALMRLEDGTFGICEECGEEISEQRLKARPVTTLCIKCKEKQETEEKVIGFRGSSHESGWIIP